MKRILAAVSTLAWVTSGSAIPAQAQPKAAPTQTKPADAKGDSDKASPGKAPETKLPAPKTTAMPGAAEAGTAKSVLFPVADQPELTRELHRAMLRVGHAVQLSSLSPEELMLAVGCNSFSVACLQKVGKMVQASSLVLPKLTVVAGAKKLSFRWFDVNSGADAGKHALTVPSEVGKRDVALQRACRTLFGMPTPKAHVVPNTGEMIIIAKVPMAEIVLNGQPRGVAPLNLANLGAGTYSVKARKPGYHTWESEVTVKVGHITHVKVEMIRSAIPPRPSGFMATVQPQTWIVAGVGVTALAVGIGFAAHMASQQNEFDRLVGNTSYEIRRMQSLKNSGDRDAVVANVMFAVAGAMTIATAVLAYLDYRRISRPETATRGPETGVRVSVGPQSVQLRLSF